MRLAADWLLYLESTHRFLSAKKPFSRAMWCCDKKIGFTKRGDVPAGLDPPTPSGTPDGAYLMGGIMSRWRRRYDLTGSRRTASQPIEGAAADPYRPPAAWKAANQHLSPGPDSQL